MASIAFKTTKFMLDVISKMVKANVRLHNTEAIGKDMAIIFVVNHFTRVETVLLPYHIHRATGLECWSLAAGDLFFGRLGKFLHSIGTVSTEASNRDKTIIHSLLAGENPWIIFPEGAMIKDKQMVDAMGEFRVFSRGVHRPPHTGAAFLALHAEYYRHKLQCIREGAGEDNHGALLERFGLKSFDQAAGRRTVIIPINITYYPIRSKPNIIMRIARALAKDMSPRALEELSVEGTALAADSSIDIRFGDPIDVGSYLHRPEFEELLACGEDDIEAIENNPKSVFNTVAGEIMQRYMTEIYRLTTINFDHLFASIIRYQKAKSFTDRSYRNRIFLAAHRLLGEREYRMHHQVTEQFREILYEEPNARFDDFVNLSLKEGILSRRGMTFTKNFALRRGKTDFHSIRQKELTYVIANEIEPLSDVIELIQSVSRATRKEISREIREIFISEDQRIFKEDYERFFKKKKSKRADIGRPFFLIPNKVRAGIVLIHGYLAAPFEIRALADRFLAEGYAVYGVRLRGHGTSPEDLADVPWEEWYESVNRGYAIVKSLTDKIIVGGFSTGAGLALLAAGNKGSRVHTVFSINAPLQLRTDAVRLVPSAVAVNALLGWMNLGKNEWEYLENDPENEQINYARNPMVGVKQLGEAMVAMERRLDKIASPTLIIQGSRDPVVDPACSGLIFTQVGTAQKELAVFERGRHGIINGEGSEDIFDRVVQFLHWADRKREEERRISAE
ncbi:alpha/beta fold hydrolase [Candidatus Sumerlaeota bacterium]|nr:alpha/beta fold hydrolase [Candidatus Sumerlaeota bacterium]